MIPYFGFLLFLWSSFGLENGLTLLSIVSSTVKMWKLEVRPSILLLVQISYLIQFTCVTSPEYNLYYYLPLTEVLKIWPSTVFFATLWSNSDHLIEYCEIIRFKSFYCSMKAFLRWCCRSHIKYVNPLRGWKYCSVI